MAPARAPSRDTGTREEPRIVLFHFFTTYSTYQVLGVQYTVIPIDARIDCGSRCARALGPMRLRGSAKRIDALVRDLGDSDHRVSDSALLYLDGVEPATLARHAGAVLSKLHSEQANTRCLALVVLCNLEPAELVKHAHALLSMLDDHEVISEAFVGFLNKMGLATIDVGDSVRNVAICTLWGLPAFVTCDDGFHRRDFDDPAPGNLRSRLLGRIAWYRCRLRMRVRHIALYWYALPYRPSGPGHARDVAAWDQMNKRSRVV